MDELLDIVPPKEGIVRIHWHSDSLERPVYEEATATSTLLALTVHVFTIPVFELVFRPSATTTSVLRVSVQSVRDLMASIRFQVVNLPIDDEYTSLQRRRHAGRGSDSVYDQCYAPTNPGTDGQVIYAGDAPRALELYELVTGAQFSAVFAELESLPDSDDATIKKERADILGRLRGLKLAALKEYREKQKGNPQHTTKTAKTKDVGHHHIPFSRISHLMPVRQRLSCSLFTVAAIRSSAGRAVLKDLIELYRSEYSRGPTWLRAGELPLRGPEEVCIIFQGDFRR